MKIVGPILIVILFAGCQSSPIRPKPSAPETPANIFPGNLIPTSAAPVPIRAMIAKAQPLTVIQPKPPSATLISSVNVFVQWKPSPDSAVAGYNIYFGNQSGEYTNNINTGTNQSVVVSNLVSGYEYYFAVTAYDTNGIESAFSGETIYAVPQWLEMTFEFPAAVPAASIQSSSDLMSWDYAAYKTVGMTNNVFIVRATVDRTSAFFRAVAVMP